MRIGLDFDNTVVCYDELFHRAAFEEGLIPADLPPGKVSVRDYLRRQGREEQWILLQGTVYGRRMTEATIFPGVIDFLHMAEGAGAEVVIVSHRTLHPARGPAYDLHRAARDWVDLHLVGEHGSLLPSERLFFELTKEEKLRRIGACGCEFFVDDLPDILTAPSFPATTTRFLFDPTGQLPLAADVTSVASWTMLAQHFAERWSTIP